MLKVTGNWISPVFKRLRYHQFCQFLGGGKNCCHTVEVIQGGHSYGAKEAHPQMFTKFYMDSVAQQKGRVRYLSQDETLAIAMAHGNWEIQSARDG